MVIKDYTNNLLFLYGVVKSF